MKITLNIDDELLRQARLRAAKEGVALSRMVENALRRHLGKRYKLLWRTEQGQLLASGSLADRTKLFDLMDGQS
jgi:post-segregation antitoxin (ccd killing protein)